jgi:hypothetical protein
MLVIKRPPVNSPLWKKRHSMYTCFLDIDKCSKCKKELDRQYHKSQKHKDRIKYRKENDINFKLTEVLRNRLRSAIKRNSKEGSAVQDLGCTIIELKIYLEKQFRDDMDWKNHGKKWHIDHIKPLAKFDLTNREELLKACHYTNLQPLLVFENLSKGCK